MNILKSAGDIEQENKSIVSTILSNILKQLDAGPLTLGQKFLLVTLDADTLSKFPRLKEESAKIITEIEKEFVKDLARFKKASQNAEHQSAREISQAIEELEKSAFTDNINRKTELLHSLKSELNKDPFNYSDETFSTIEQLLNQIDQLHPEKYLLAQGLAKIASIQAQHSLELSINENLYTSPEAYQDILKAEETKQQQLFTIRDELCTYKYALYFSGINEEILFAAGFINPDLLENKAPTLLKYLKKRTQLYVDIKKYIINSTKYDILPLTNLTYPFSEASKTRLLYFRLRKLINCYLYLCEKDPARPTLYPKIKEHLELMVRISTDTDLLNPEITTMYGTHFSRLLGTLGINQGDVATLLGITNSALSQELNKKNPSQKYLPIIARLYNCSLYFLQEKTTMPRYDKSSDNLKDLWLIVNRQAIGEYFLGYASDLFKQYKQINDGFYKELSDPIEQEHFQAITDHIKFLRQAYNNLSPSFLNAVTNLLKAGLKNNTPGK